MHLLLKNITHNNQFKTIVYMRDKVLIVFAENMSYQLI